MTNQINEAVLKLAMEQAHEQRLTLLVCLTVALCMVCWVVVCILKAAKREEAKPS